MKSVFIFRYVGAMSYTATSREIIYNFRWKGECPLEHSPFDLLFSWGEIWDSSPAGEPVRGSDAPPARHSLPLTSNPFRYFP